MIALTMGLAYPFAQASLERFKLRKTWYGDLQGHFIGSGTRLVFRGIPLWIVVVGPLTLGMFIAVGQVDWNALGPGSGDMMGRVEAAGVAPALAFAGLSVGWCVGRLPLLSSAFQGRVL